MFIRFLKLATKLKDALLIPASPRSTSAKINPTTNTTDPFTAFCQELHKDKQDLIRITKELTAALNQIKFPGLNVHKNIVPEGKKPPWSYNNLQDFAAQATQELKPFDDALITLNTQFTESGNAERAMDLCEKSLIIASYLLGYIEKIDADIKTTKVTQDMIMRISGLSFLPENALSFSRWLFKVGQGDFIRDFYQHIDIVKKNVFLFLKSPEKFKKPEPNPDLHITRTVERPASHGTFAPLNPESPAVLHLTPHHEHTVPRP